MPMPDIARLLDVCGHGAAASRMRQTALEGGSNPGLTLEEVTDLISCWADETRVARRNATP